MSLLFPSTTFLDGNVVSCDQLAASHASPAYLTLHRGLSLSLFFAHSHLRATGYLLCTLTLTLTQTGGVYSSQFRSPCALSIATFRVSSDGGCNSVLQFLLIAPFYIHTAAPFPQQAPSLLHPPPSPSPSFHIHPHTLLIEAILSPPPFDGNEKRLFRRGRRGGGGLRLSFAPAPSPDSQSERAGKNENGNDPVRILSDLPTHRR